MVVCCVSGVQDIGKALDLIYTHLLGAADMEPADEATQAALQQKLDALHYPWPEHDGSALPVGVYVPDGDGPVLTIEADRVSFPLDDDETAVFPLGQPQKSGECLSCCGMQEGALHMLLRMLNAPFMLDAVCRFDGETAELTLSGVGQEGKRYPLKRKA